jgi:hypothetical protein
VAVHDYWDAEHHDWHHQVEGPWLGEAEVIRYLSRMTAPRDSLYAGYRFPAEFISWTNPLRGSRVNRLRFSNPIGSAGGTDPLPLAQQLNWETMRSRHVAGLISQRSCS